MTWQDVTLILGIVVCITIVIVATVWGQVYGPTEIRSELVDAEKRLSRS
jgi:hypothetical protein